MSATKLAEVVAFPTSAEYNDLAPQLRTDYTRNDAVGYGYAWGRLDQGHKPIVSTKEGVAPSTTDTVWVFAGLYARMLLELHNPEHLRSTALSVQSAWQVFAETGCPDGSLPQRLS